MMRRTIDRIDAAMKLAPWSINERGCWICMAGFHESQGYRLLNVLGRRIRAHRLAYRVFKGLIPRGMIVRHSCDTPECINPAHLLMGTRQENACDMVERGRVARIGRRQKLSTSQIIDIRHRPESSYKLSAIYGVTSTHIRRIRKGARCAGIQ